MGTPTSPSRTTCTGTCSWAPGRRRQVRAQVLFRDQWTSQICGGRADHVDYITPVLFGGTDDEGNLRAL
jgi:hypothetical protein